ncbi:MAG: Bax inhibitor-1/YccA family protein [Erysipelotrichaceae bacterium]|nr:Bax inhibitor-1/YccA family protein [Erysipelotrichaceae bacterium]
MNDFENYQEINHVSRLDFFSKVMGYLALGLGLSAIGALAGNYMMPLLGQAYMFAMLFFMAAELVLAFVIGRNLESRSTAAVKGMFVAYSLINGLTLSVILSVYTAASVLMAFATTAVVFGSLCAIGRTTKVDLTRMGPFFMTGLVSCIILTIVNMLFFRASGLDIALCYIETLLFMGITVYDMQMIDRYYSQSESENFAIFAALQLELDFINLLIRVLEIFGVRRSDN